MTEQRFRERKLDTATKNHFDSDAHGHADGHGGNGRASGTKSQASNSRKLRSLTKTNGRRRERPLLPRNTQHLVGTKVQFVREEKFAISRMGRPPQADGRSRPPRHCIFDVINEAGRLGPEGYRHLVAQGLEPSPPNCLYGVEADQLMTWYAAHVERAAQNRQEQRFVHKTVLKRQPQNVPTVLGVVASYPGPPDDKDAVYCEWRALVTRWAIQHYGHENVVSVLEHRDEPHGHVHVIVAYPEATSVVWLHAAERTRRQAQARGETGIQLGQAYRAGGQALQDEFHQEVGRHVGLERIGPEPFRRHSYQEAKVRRQMDEEIREASTRLDQREERLRSQQADLDRRAALLMKAEEELNAMQRAMRRALLQREGSLKEQAEQQAAERLAMQRDREASEAARRESEAQTQAVLDWIGARVKAGDMRVDEAKTLVTDLVARVRDVVPRRSQRR